MSSDRSPVTWGRSVAQYPLLDDPIKSTPPVDRRTSRSTNPPSGGRGILGGGILGGGGYGMPYGIGSGWRCPSLTLPVFRAGVRGQLAVTLGCCPPGSGGGGGGGGLLLHSPHQPPHGGGGVEVPSGTLTDPVWHHPPPQPQPQPCHRATGIDFGPMTRQCPTTTPQTPPQGMVYVPQGQGTRWGQPISYTPVALWGIPYTDPTPSPLSDGSAPASPSTASTTSCGTEGSRCLTPRVLYVVCP